jgi:hypothetical protein
VSHQKTVAAEAAAETEAVDPLRNDDEQSEQVAQPPAPAVLE